MSNFFPEMNQQFSKEVEDEANSYFQRIYNHIPHPTMSTDEVLDMLKKFKDSSNKKERVSVYASVRFHVFVHVPGIISTCAIRMVQLGCYVCFCHCTTLMLCLPKETLHQLQNHIDHTRMLYPFSLLHGGSYAVTLY